MKPFFITGLPRCRTAWLANFLTWGDSFCYHEAVTRCATMSDLTTIFRSVPIGTRYVGDADPSLGYVPLAILEEYPDCRIAFIHRPLEESVESEWNAITWDGSPAFEKATKEGIQEQLVQLSLGISHLWKNLPPHRRMMTTFKDLEKETIVETIWHFCLPNTPFPRKRYEMLEDLRVTQMAGKLVRKHSYEPFTKLVNSQQEAAVCLDR